MKKIISILLTLIVAIGILPLTAFAADPSPIIDTSPLLSIDNKSAYKGMDKPYSAGYIPSVQNGTALVVIPLVATPGTITGDVTITVNLGEPSSSPFVFGNYDQTVMLEDNKVNNETATQSSYLVSLSLPMIPDRVNGRYPVIVTAQYVKASDSTTYSQAFTVYVTVTDGIDPNASPAPTPTPTPVPTEAPVHQPKLIVEGHTITPTDVMAGGTFALNVTLKNTSDSQSVQNIKITAKGDTTDLIPEDDTGSTYIQKIGSGKTADFLVKMQVRPDAKPGPQKVLLAIDYENSKATAFTTSEEIIVQVKQPIRLEYDQPTIPESVNSGDTITISMNLMNMGKSTLYNVRCTLEAPGLIPEGSIFLGNMESGTSKTGDIYVFVGTLDIAGMDMSGDETSGADLSGESDSDSAPAALEPAAAVPGLSVQSRSKVKSSVEAESKEVIISEEAVDEIILPDDASGPVDPAEYGDAVQIGQYGPSEGKIIITYEDEYGQEYSQEVGFMTVINPPVIQPVITDEEVTEEPATVSQWWISVIIAGGIAAGLIAFLKIRNKRRMLLEDQDEDE